MSSRIGLAGCGRIVEKGHLAAYRSNADLMEICALADPCAERRDAVGDALGVAPEHRYDDTGSMLEANALDAVVVATPPAFHRPVILAALAAGCDVMSEKPLCASLDELAQIERESQRTGKSVAVMHNFLFGRGWRMLLDHTRQGGIGRPVLLRIEELSGGYFGASDGAPPLWREAMAAGSGPLQDNLYHALYLAEALMESPIRRGAAQLADLVRGYACGDVAIAVLEHDNGAITEAISSWCHPGRWTAKVEITCERGLLRYRYWDQPDTIEIEVGDDVRSLRADGWDDTDEDGYGDAFRHWIEAIRARRPPPHGLGEARRMLEIFDRIATARSECL